jgi:hypothetical protein
MNNQTSIDALNNCRPGKEFLPVKKAQDLKLGKLYNAHTIKKVQTKMYGHVYVVESDEFSMYLPQKYSSIDIIENMPGRHFKIVGFKTFGEKTTPDIIFSLEM